MALQATSPERYHLIDFGKRHPWGETLNDGQQLAPAVTCPAYFLFLTGYQTRFKNKRKAINF
jgi:hypothetical protein